MFCSNVLEMGTGMLLCWEGKTDSFRAGWVAYHHNKKLHWGVWPKCYGKRDGLKGLSFGLDFTFFECFVFIV